jgi:hypothetical protein
MSQARLLLTVGILVGGCVSRTQTLDAGAEASRILGVLYLLTDDARPIIRHVGAGSIAEGWGLQSGDLLVEIGGRVTPSRAAATELMRAAASSPNCPDFVVVRASRTLKLQCRKGGESIAARDLLEEATRKHPTVEISGPPDLVSAGEYPLGESLSEVVDSALLTPAARKETFCFYRIPGDVGPMCGDFGLLERQHERTGYIVFIRSARVGCFMRHIKIREMSLGSVSSGGLAEVDVPDAMVVVQAGDRLGDECEEVERVDYAGDCIVMKSGTRICSGGASAGRVADGG